MKEVQTDATGRVLTAEDHKAAEKEQKEANKRAEQEELTEKNDPKKNEKK